MQRLVEACFAHTVARILTRTKHTHINAHRHTDTQTQSVRSGGSDGTKDHSETKAQMTPSCDNPNCSYLPLSDNISNALKKEPLLN